MYKEALKERRAPLSVAGRGHAASSTCLQFSKQFSGTTMFVCTAFLQRSASPTPTHSTPKPESLTGSAWLKTRRHDSGFKIWR